VNIKANIIHWPMQLRSFCRRHRSQNGLENGGWGGSNYPRTYLSMAENLSYTIYKFSLCRS